MKRLKMSRGKAAALGGTLVLGGVAGAAYGSHCYSNCVRSAQAYETAAVQRVTRFRKQKRDLRSQLNREAAADQWFSAKDTLESLHTVGLMLARYEEQPKVQADLKRYNESQKELKSLRHGYIAGCVAGGGASMLGLMFLLWAGFPKPERTGGLDDLPMGEPMGSGQGRTERFD